MVLLLNPLHLQLSSPLFALSTSRNANTCQWHDLPPLVPAPKRLPPPLLAPAKKRIQFQKQSQFWVKLSRWGITLMHIFILWHLCLVLDYCSAACSKTFLISATNSLHASMQWLLLHFLACCCPEKTAARAGSCTYLDFSPKSLQWPYYLDCWLF